MLSLRKSDARGVFQNDWLDSRHSFSFAEYYDPDHMGFSLLRVLNDDRVSAKGGFGMHSHREMEIISYPLAGTLEHKDNTGAGGVVRRGDVQRMSAGSGIQHSEFNPSDKDESHFLQIWLLPTQAGVKANYAQRHFSEHDKRGRLCLVVSKDGRDGSISSQTDVSLYASQLDDQQSLHYQLAADRVAYLHLATGQLSLNGEQLQAGDAACISAGSSLHIDAATDAELLLFDLPNIQ